MNRDPLDLRTFADVVQTTELDRFEVLEAIADGRLHAVFLGLELRVPQEELDRFAGELELTRSEGPA